MVIIPPPRPILLTLSEVTRAVPNTRPANEENSQAQGQVSQLLLTLVKFINLRENPKIKIGVVFGWPKVWSDDGWKMSG